LLSERGKLKSRQDLINSLKTTLQLVNPKLDGHEKIHNIVIVKEDWTVENELLTPTMKIKRNAIEKIYQCNYVSWYEEDSVLFL
tara:strand:+ start:228 stop:479 length:252 start_codon:yes stop_codon:yes gene_type:complete